MAEPGSGPSATVKVAGSEPNPAAASLRDSSFYLALVAIFLPVIMKGCVAAGALLPNARDEVLGGPLEALLRSPRPLAIPIRYDVLIAAPIRMRKTHTDENGRFSWKELCAALSAFFAAVPSIVLALVGMDAGRALHMDMMDTDIADNMGQIADAGEDLQDTIELGGRPSNLIHQEDKSDEESSEKEERVAAASRAGTGSRSLFRFGSSKSESSTPEGSRVSVRSDRSTPRGWIRRVKE